MTRPLHHNKCIEGEKASINDSTSRDIKQTHYRPTSRSTGRHVGLNLSCVSARSEYSDDVPETGSCGKPVLVFSCEAGNNGLCFVRCWNVAQSSECSPYQTLGSYGALFLFNAHTYVSSRKQHRISGTVFVEMISCSGKSSGGGTQVYVLSLDTSSFWSNTFARADECMRALAGRVAMIQVVVEDNPSCHSTSPSSAQRLLFDKPRTRSRPSNKADLQAKSRRSAPSKTIGDNLPHGRLQFLQVCETLSDALGDLKGFSLWQAEGRQFLSEVLAQGRVCDSGAHGYAEDTTQAAKEIAASSGDGLVVFGSVGDEADEG